MNSYCTHIIIICKIDYIFSRHETLVAHSIYAFTIDELLYRDMLDYKT